MERFPKNIANSITGCSIFVSSFLGVLDRRFLSYRPDSNNPSYRKLSKTFFFCLVNHVDNLSKNPENCSVFPSISKYLLIQVNTKI